MERKDARRDAEYDTRAINERKFVGYITSLLHFNSINYDKKKRKDNERFRLILDDAEEEMVQSEVSINIDYTEYLKLEDQISDDELYYDFMKLTNREREILEYFVYHELNDTEISRILHVSQQSVSKTKKTALEKLRTGMKRNNPVKAGK